ncbi:MAG TPA: hypothetical protein VGK67_36275 [Myxococcales bacterium]|jgi:hypothetical protein
MPELLGSILLRQGLVTQGQLDAGLAAQAKNKGRLGTNLVELKHLTLARLGNALLEQRGGNLATKEELDAATANVLVSKRVAKLHLAVPIRVENRVLVVAMASAWDPEAVDALERELRSRVQAKLAPELVVLRYLDRIYDLKSGRPVSVYDHLYSAAPEGVSSSTEFLSSSGFLTDEGDEAFLNAAAPAPPLRPLGPPSRPSRPGEPAPASRPSPGKPPARAHIESSFDSLVRAGVPVLSKAPKAVGAGGPRVAEEQLEEVEPLPDDLPVLSGMVVEGSAAPAADQGQAPAAPLPDIPDEWK